MRNNPEQQKAGGEHPARVLEKESLLERDIASLKLGNSALERQLAHTLERLAKLLDQNERLPRTIKGVPLEDALGVAGKLIKALSAEKLFTQAEHASLGFGLLATALGGALLIMGQENPDPHQLQAALEQVKTWIPILRSHIESLQNTANPMQLLGFAGIGAGTGSAAFAVGVIEKIRESAGKKARRLKYED
ncbi:MAG: hypothetical protein Q8P56_03790 [Candidatus Uhrbacteria bacterium]|nr:hypothetical protein [Candidatus Uhrbacteria bacterium]